jgi:hypothetical protein
MPSGTYWWMTVNLMAASRTATRSGNPEGVALRLVT